VADIEPLDVATAGDNDPQRWRMTRSIPTTASPTSEQASRARSRIGLPLVALLSHKEPGLITAANVNGRCWRSPDRADDDSGVLRPDEHTLSLATTHVTPIPATVGALAAIASRAESASRRRRHDEPIPTTSS
jgi:hypothetical protein